MSHGSGIIQLSEIRGLCQIKIFHYQILTWLLQFVRASTSLESNAQPVVQEGKKYVYYFEFLATYQINDVYRNGNHISKLMAQLCSD